MLTIQQDSREKSDKKEHILNYFADNGIKVVRSKLFVGDYTLLNKQDVVIDTKASILEIISNLTTQHKRFKAECVRAMEANIRLIILIEEYPKNGDIRNWTSPLWKSDGYKTINGKRIKTHSKGDKISNASSRAAYRTMFTMNQRYGVTFEFVDKDNSGRRIIELLTQ